MNLHVVLDINVNGNSVYDFEYSGSTDLDSIKRFAAQQLDVGISFFDNYTYDNNAQALIVMAVYG